MKTIVFIVTLIISSKMLAADSLKYVQYQKLDLNDTLKVRLQSELEWLTPLNLSFCVPELLFLLKTDPGFKEKWKKKIQNYQKVFDDSLSYFLSDQEILFFEQTITKNNLFLRNYSSEITFLNSNRFGSGYIHQGVISHLRRYSVSDNKKGLSTLFFTLIIIQGEDFVKQSETDLALRPAFHSWLQDIPNMEFLASESINYASQIIKRKRSYIIDCYGDSVHPQMRKLVSVVKKSKITVID